MNKVRFTINAIATVLLTVLFASLAQAQATRTWVSGVGDDVNPCSRTAPCKTFAGAISKTAPGGEIDALDPGGFGAVTITKSITIDGTQGAGFGSILASATNGVIINAAAATDVVTLRNLSINGANTGLIGIKILAAKAVHIENCQIFGFRGSSAGTNGRGISDERTGAGAQLFIKDTIVRNNIQSGIGVGPAAGAGTVAASMNNVRSDGNGNAGFVINSGGKVTISNSGAGGNVGSGFFVEGASGTAELNLESCVSSHNAQGITNQTGGVARLSNVQIANNTSTGLSAGGGVWVTFGNNKIGANGAGGGVGVSLTAVGANVVSVQ